MTISYHIVPYSPSILFNISDEDELPNIGWDITNKQFAEALTSSYPDSQILRGEPYVEWESHQLENPSGKYYSYRLVIHGGTLKGFVDFVNWYRDLIPLKHILYMFYLEGSTVMKLTKAITIDELKLHFGSG